MVRNITHERWINKIHQGDVIEVLKKMPNNLVDMIITSPPYWNLRSYDVDGQIGLEVHPNQYISKMVEVGKELRRVLKPTGSYYINLGDSFWGGGMKRPGNDNPFQLETEKQRQFIKEKLGGKLKPDGKWLQPKQLLLIPSRVAIAMQEDGWTLRSDLVWIKNNPMPSPIKDRYNTSYEHVFFFTKDRKYYFDLDAIRVPHSSKALPKKEDKIIVTLEEGLKNIKGWDNSKAKWSQSDDDHINKQFTDKHDMHYDGTGYHPLGRNPNDILESNDNEIQQHIQAVYKKYQSAQREIYIGSKYKDKEGMQATSLTETLTTLRKIAKEYISEHQLNGLVAEAILDYAHNNAGHPLGKNPNDVYEQSKYLSKEQESSVRQGFTKDRDPADFRNPLGRNPCDVLHVNTQPTKDAHFATFPPTLLEVPMKASCPERVCKKCGAPKVRITDFDESGKKIVKWEDWCKCDAGYEPGIVLDPFMGSGTTALLAKQMNRRFVGIELNPEYIEMAVKRLGKNVVTYQYEYKDGDDTYDDDHDFDFSV